MRGRSYTSRPQMSGISLVWGRCYIYYGIAAVTIERLSAR